MLKEELTLEEDGFTDPHVLTFQFIKKLNLGQIIKATTWDASIIAMKEQLLSALTLKKQKILPIALKIFNSVQDKHLKTERIGEYSAHKDDIDVD